ncbi:MAG: DUF4468 domain-containing protein [Bacteroidia bacterium]
MVKKLILASLLSVSVTGVFSQDKTEDVSKMIREVIPVEVDKSLFKTSPTPQPTQTVATTDKKGKKKAADDTPPPTDTPPTDTTGNTTMPAPASEVAKRAQIWMADKPTKYSKTNCSNGGNGVVCQVSFAYKVKELNPTDNVDGEITMTITVEAKEGKYRYTINNIKHKATVAGSSGGDVYGIVAECGSMKLSDLSWKHIKSAAFADAKMVADDLKATMAKFSGDAPKKDDW